MLFKDESGNASDAQMVAFGDTWHWGPRSAKTYNDLITKGDEQVAHMMNALRDMLSANQMMAYLVMMAARLVELHRVLKPSGSLWLHCDPTASHYLKIVLDAIFSVDLFVNEITWKRSYGHGDSKRSMGRAHDIILVYGKTSSYVLNRFYHAHSPEYLKHFFRHRDERGIYKLENLTSPNPRPNLTYSYKGYPPPSKGWRVAPEKMAQLDAEGRLHFPSKSQGRIMRKVYLHELEGQPMTDTWTDIKPLSAHDKERLGYPTQKPLALLERIVAAASNPGDVVLDPFCGCGTAIAAAQKLGRKWIGIDITILSLTLQKYRLRDMFDLKPKRDYKSRGEPTTLSEARALALDPDDRRRLEFQKWALSLVQAKPVKISPSGDIVAGKDGSVDGAINFIDDASDKRKEVLVQVKSGKIKSGDIRDLRGAMARRKSVMGVFVTLEDPTRNMLAEAVSAGFYDSPGWGKAYPTLQILTVDQLLRGSEVKMPPPFGTFKQASRVKDESEYRNMTLDEAPRNGDAE